MSEHLAEMLIWLVECLPDYIKEEVLQYFDFLLSRVGADKEAEGDCQSAKKEFSEQTLLQDADCNNE